MEPRRGKRDEFVVGIDELIDRTAANITPGVLRDLFSARNIIAKFRFEHKDLWDAAHDLIPYVPVLYTNSSIDYQIAYQQGHGGYWQDCSLILFWDLKPAAIWPLSISTKDANTELTSHGLAVLPPLFTQGLATKTVKTLSRQCLQVAESFSRQAAQVSWHSSQSFGNLFGLSQWHTIAVAGGAIPCLQHELYLDLSPEMKTIKGGIRDSFRSLITAGARHWEIGLLTSESPSIWHEFKQLHFDVAGRATRSAESWDMQLQRVKIGSSFLVYLRNHFGQMVGAGFFSLSRDEGQYDVGAYDRALFDKPLGHVVQYRAIQELKARGIRWYKIGARPFACDSPVPTEKEMSISDFKQGFASHIFPKFHLLHRVTENPLQNPEN